ncbi:MAG TPA: site-2 protease family protein [Candidatus Binatia bacterium]|jgi:Zn-dependent protease|nr:site-2 protease family protein [Candidatus Binatia bacterium]
MDATATTAAPKRKYGILALLAKLGGKFLALLAKLLKTLKVGKVVLAGASFGAYALLFSWKFALVLIASLVFHEMGHLWAMHRYGLKTKGIYLIPLLGAAAVSEEAFPSRKAETVIALMGPLWGFGLALGVFGLYGLTHEPLFAALAGWMAMLNLFNLLPVNPLDGGRVMKSIAYSISSRLGVAFLACGILGGFVLAHYFNFGLVTFLTIFGAMELAGEVRRIRAVQDRKRVLDALAAKLGCEAEPEAVIATITRVSGQLRKGATAMFPPRLLDANPYTGRFEAREWSSHFLDRVERVAREARREQTSIFRRRKYHVTPIHALNVSTEEDGALGGDQPLFDFLRNKKDAMPAMTPLETAGGAAAYVGLAIMLAALMFATAHIPAAGAAMHVFIG